MRYMQARVTDKQHLEIKKHVLDLGISLETFIKQAVFEKMISDIAKTNAVKEEPSLQNHKGVTHG